MLQDTKRLLILILIFISLFNAFIESKKSRLLGKGYAFYYPTHVSVNQQIKVCLSLEKHLLPAKVNISIVNEFENQNLSKLHTVTSDFSCWEITAPDRSSFSDYYCNIKIVTKGDITIKDSGRVRVHENEKRIFGELDRNVYKMGDTVRFRYLAIGSDLKPIKDHKISSIQLHSPYPSSAIVKKWENITTVFGLAHLEFQLAPDAPEGTWSIFGGGVFSHFEVRKYVLPRFQVILTGPKSVYRLAETVTYSVCGKYSYGKYVRGQAALEVRLYRTTRIVKDLENGCATFELLAKDVGLDYVFPVGFDITVSVIEYGTGQTESTSTHTYVDNNAYLFEWDSQNEYDVKPGLPYVGKVELTDVKVPLEKPLVKMCYAVDRGGTTTCSNFMLRSGGVLTFTIPPLKNLSDNIHVFITASILGAPDVSYPNRDFSLTVWSSESGNGIVILKGESNISDCWPTLTYTVLYNSGRFRDRQKEIEFKYMLTMKGVIVAAGVVLDKPEMKSLNLDEYPNVIGKENYVDYVNPIDQFELKIKLDKKIYTKANLLVYYECDGEIISDSVEVEVRNCQPNLVTAAWNEETLYPGEVGRLSIKTGQNSLCSVSSVDKASTFLGDSIKITSDDVLNQLNRFYYHPRYDLDCIKPESNNSNDHGPQVYYSYYQPETLDAFDAFKDSNIGVLSNLKFISKKCGVHIMENYPSPLMYGPIPFAAPPTYDAQLPGFSPHAGAPGLSPSFASPEASGMPGSSPIPAGPPVGAGAVDNRGSAIRYLFPETWLWDLVPVQDGEVTLERKLPDSITDWKGNVLCMSSADGFGITNDIQIKGFKPFFVNALLPYSIKRNKEILHLPIQVFNYLNHSLPIRVVLKPSEDIVLMDEENEASFHRCLGADESYTHHYRIKATKLGLVNITVEGNVDPAYAENCAPESVVRRRDVVRKSLLVEPEGYPSSLLKSILVCANGTGVRNLKWQIKLPKNVVPDTIDGKVTINSDVLGPVFRNLENLLQVPTGCGEQTMASLTPNLYVLQYLEANDALTDKVKEKIFKNLDIGYQRMLRYANSDGSFSAFGSGDAGSMFLTSFVVRTFRQMKKYIFIDDNVMDRAIRWIVSNQLENGCFDTKHHVFHEMGGASLRGQTTALTSYVLISLLETDTKISKEILSKAKECVRRDHTSDKYNMAISSYALGLMNLTVEARDRLDRLLDVAMNKKGKIWWAQSEKYYSTNVEVSGYVLISLLRQDSIGNLGIGSSIVRWLQSQMNSRGGFYSTADTVVGLDAISRYAALLNKKEPNVTILLSTNNSVNSLKITKRDHTKTSVIPLTVYPNNVSAKIEGDGCVSIQADVKYYVDQSPTVDNLQLDIEIKPANPRWKCALIEIKPCVSYTGLGKINMAIVEINMFSGYTPDHASLNKVTNTFNSVVKKFEQIRNQVVFYLTEVGAEEICMPFIVEENLVVENVTKANAKFYDYYKPGLTVSKSFKLEDCEVNINVPA